MLGLMSVSARRRATEKAESIAALRRAAARRLPKVIFDFIDGAAGDEATLRDNEAVARCNFSVGGDGGIDFFREPSSKVGNSRTSTAGTC
jgi:hypothetical protein